MQEEERWQRELRRLAEESVVFAFFPVWPLLCWVHVYCMPNCARINNLCKIPVYSKLSLFMLMRNLYCYEIAVWKTRFWNARIINCFITGKDFFFVWVFFCHVIIPFRSQFACCLLWMICNSLTCPSTSLFQGRKLCSINMGSECLKQENFILGNDILCGGGWF